MQNPERTSQGHPAGLDTLVGRFEQLWLEGGRPSLDAFLGGLSPQERRLALAELAHVDLEFRLQSGEAARVEEYLQRFPELDCPEVVYALVSTEYRQRRRREAVSSAEYAVRFPRLGLEGDAMLALAAVSATANGRPAATTPRQRPDGTGTPSAWPAVPGFEILGELGRGGMGIVYRARQVRLKRLVALKMIRGGRPDEQERQRFQAEAEAAARLQHPNVVQVYEVGEHEGLPYLALELVEGGTLADHLARRPLAFRPAAELVATLARAVHTAHEMGIVHRDLKPANVLLTTQGIPKVADFGLAKRMGEAGQTQSGAVLGTPSYMAPEQAAGRGSGIGPYTDVYALGAILYELLTGRPPFVGDDRLDLLLQVSMLEPVPPGRLRPRLPRDLEVICLKCLQKRPADRYPTAAALADDLHRFLGNVPIKARPPSAWRQAAAWARRHRVTAVLLAAGLVLLATVLGGLAWHTTRLGREQDAKEQERLKAVRHQRRAREAEHASRLRLADQSFRLGDRFVLAGLLDPSQPASQEEEDLRGFEWYRLTGFRHPPWRLCALQGKPPNWLGYSPDGRWLAVGLPAAGRVEVWDTATGKLHFQVPHVASASPVFGPAGSGWLAIAAGTEVTRWDLQTGRRQGGPIQVGHEVHALALHPDGRLILGGQGPLMAWTPDSGVCPVRLSGGPEKLSSLSVNPNGKSLAINDPGAHVAVWDLPTGKRRLEPAPQEGAPGGLAYSPRGSYLWYIRSDSLVRLLHEADLVPLVDDFPRMPGGATALAFSPDERTVVTGGPDGLVRFWDIQSRDLRAQLRWQSHAARCLAFAPDGATLAVATADGMIYQVATALRPEQERLGPRLGHADCAAWSPDGKVLAVGYSAGTIQLIDARTGTVRRELQGLGNPVGQLGFSADGTTLAAVTWGDRFHLWDAATARPIPCDVPVARRIAFAPKGSLLALAGDGVHFVDGSGKQRGTIPSEREVLGMAFSPDGRTLATGNHGRLVLWDLSKGLASPTAVARQEMVRGPGCLTFLPDGTLATGEDGGVIRFWKASGGKLVPAREPLKGLSRITDLVVLSDGKTFLTNEPSYRPRFWDLQSHEWKVEWLFGARFFPSPDGRTLATCSCQGVVQLTDMQTWTTRLLAGQPMWPVYGLAITPNGQELITLSDAPTPEVRERQSAGSRTESTHLQDLGVSLRCWGLADGAERPGLTGPLSMALPSRLALSRDGRNLAAGSEDGSIYVWDRGSRSIQTRLFVSPGAKEYAAAQELARSRGPASPDYPEEIRSLAFAADGSLLAAASSLGTVTVWEVAGWRQVHSLRLDAAEPAWAAFAPDGALVVPQGGRVRFLDPRTGKELRGLGKVEDTPALGVAFTAHGDRMAVHHQHRLIRLWDLADATAVDLHGHLDEVSALAFTPDGRTLASSSHDRTVKLWSVAAGAEVASLEGHTGRIHCLTFSPDGRVLVSGGEDNDGRGEVLLRCARSPD